MIDERVTEQTGDGTKARLKRTPSEAILSILGVDKEFISSP